MKIWLFRKLFAAECANQRVLEKELAEQRKQSADLFTRATDAEVSLVKLREQLGELSLVKRQLRLLRPPAAKLAYKPRMPREDVERLLAGAHAVGHIQAVMALLEGAIIAAGNVTGESPHEGYFDPVAKTHFPAFTEQMRTHAGGQLDGLAKVLGDLQELTEPREQAAASPKSAAA